MLKKDRRELEYARVVLIGVMYTPACTGEAVGFGGNLGSGLCPSWNKGFPLIDMTL